MKYIIKSINHKGYFVRFDCKLVYFDTNDEAQKFILEIQELPEFNTEKLKVISIDEDVILCLGNHFAINAKDITYDE